MIVLVWVCVGLLASGFVAVYLRQMSTARQLARFSPDLRDACSQNATAIASLGRDLTRLEGVVETNQQRIALGTKTSNENHNAIIRAVEAQGEKTRMSVDLATREIFRRLDSHETRITRLESEHEH